MKRVIIVLCIVLPYTLWAQKRASYTFDFSKPSELIPSIELSANEYNGEEVNVTDWTFRSKDNKVSISFDGRSTDNLGGFFTTGWEQEDGSFDHYLFLSRGARFIVSTIGADIESFVFEKNSFPGNLQLVAPIGIGLLDAATFNWYSQGASGITELNYSCNGQNPKIRAFTVNYILPLDILEPVRLMPADKSELHSIETIEITFEKNIKLGEGAKFELSGPAGFNPVKMNPTIDGKRVILSLPEGVVIDETNEMRRGEYTLIVNEKSIITDDEDGYFNKRMVYTFNVIEAYNKFMPDIIWPDMTQNVEKIDTILIGFPDYIKKFSSDELSLIDKNGDEARTVQAKWLEEEEYTNARPFFDGRDIRKWLQLVFCGDMTAAVKASGIYYLTIPQGFIWNSKYSPSAEDEGTSAGALFNPEVTIAYNVHGVIYPSDEVLQAAKDLLAITGAGYPAADSPARVALQNLVTEGIGADAIFQAAMDAFYAETQIELPSDGYYLLSAVPSEGDEVYLSYENGKIGLTKNENDAAHLLAKVNEDGTIVFETPDHKFLTQMMASGGNVTSDKGKTNNLTFDRLVLKDNEVTPQHLFGLWSILGIVATDDAGVDYSAYTLVNIETMSFATDLLNTKLYFTDKLTNAFRLTETDAPVPVAEYTFNPVSGSTMDDLYTIILTFTNIEEVGAVEGIKDKITLVSVSSAKYNPTKIDLVEGRKNQYRLYFEDIKAGTYTMTIPKGSFFWNYEEKSIAIPEITATYTVSSGIDFVYDFINTKNVYLYKMPDVETKVKDTDLNNILTLVIYEENTFGLTDKEVTITSTSDTIVFAKGHFVVDASFVDPERSPSTAFKLVLDKPIKAGDLGTGTYQFNIPKATFGDANFAAWLKDHQSISKKLCHVNPFMNPFISVDNDMANLIFSPENLKSVVERLSDITVTFPYHDNVVISNDDLNVIEIWEKNKQFEDVRLIKTSFVPVEGTTNKFHLASDEALTRSRGDGFYYIIVPQNLFQAGRELMPTYGHIDLYYYGSAGDAIQTVDNGELTMDNVTIYDLVGRRVNDTNKAGIYIVNGKKVLVK